MLQGIWNNQNTLLLGDKNGTPLANNLAISYKGKYLSTI